MKKFTTDKRALDFIAGKIAAEAKREGTPLTDVERKMLYFSETAWTLPDMAEVSAAFDRDCEQDEYEQKIAGLIHKITAHHNDNNLNDEENWDAAIARLSEGGRYLLAMVWAAGSAKRGPVGGGFLPTHDRPKVRPPHDFLKLMASAMAILCVALGFTLSIHWLHETKWPAAVWVIRHEGGLTYFLIVVAALVFSFWNYLRSAIQAWRDSRNRLSSSDLNHIWSSRPGGIT